MTSIAFDHRPLADVVVDLGRMRTSLRAVEAVRRAILDPSVSELHFNPGDLPLPAAVCVSRDVLEDAVDVDVFVPNDPDEPLPSPLIGLPAVRPWRFRLTERELVAA
jgi:hypothetical protein